MIFLAAEFCSLDPIKSNSSGVEKFSWPPKSFGAIPIEVPPPQCSGSDKIHSSYSLALVIILPVQFNKHFAFDTRIAVWASIWFHCQGETLSHSEKASGLFQGGEKSFRPF